MREEGPLNHHRFSIGLAAVVMLVALRISIGWHFLYEGVWKIANADKFSAEPFLSQAKGPAAPLFHAMLPDFEGRQRLAVVEANGKRTVSGQAYLDTWKDLKERVADKYALSEAQKQQAEAEYKRYEKSLQDYLAENGDAIVAHFDSLDRFKTQSEAGNNGASFQRQRDWDQQQDYRREVGAWLNELDGMGDGYQLALWNILNDEQKVVGDLPVRVTRMDLMDFAVTYGLSAIGLCLVIGLCTRLAALGGAAFLVSVLLTQPPWPTIYPPAPEVVGHALIVDKNFVEMVALLALATTAVGRWAGLDFFLYHWIGRPVEEYLGGRMGRRESDAQHA